MNPHVESSTLPTAPAGLLRGILLALFAAPLLHAQLLVSTLLDRERYMPYEPINISVTIENNTGNDLVFDHGNSSQAHITLFCKERKAPYALSAVVNRGPEGVLRLAAGQSRTVAAALNPLFKVQSEGDYEVYVQVGHPLLQRDYRGTTAAFQIRAASTLWSTEIGLPPDPADPPDSQIRTRKVSVLGFSDVKNDHYILQIEDDKRVYAVLRMGQRVSVDPPVCEIDARSNIHILLRLSARVYSYRVHDWDGRMLQSKLLATGEKEGPPALVRDRERGLVRTLGGRVARRGEDYELLDDGQVIERPR